MITKERQIELANEIINANPGAAIPVTEEELDWINTITTFQYIDTKNTLNKTSITQKEIQDEQPWI